MKTNTILNAIRQTRDDLARETGYDLKQLFDYVRDREREAAARGVKFVSPAPRETETAYALREELPNEQKDQAAVDDEDADLFSAQFKTLDVSGDKICEENTTQQPAAGQDRNFPGSALGLPVDEQAAEILLLCGVEPNFHLRQGAEEDQHQGNDQTGHRQLERREEVEQFIEHSGNARFGRTS